jgi:hypothetical protein
VPNFGRTTRRGPSLDWRSSDPSPVDKSHARPWLSSPHFTLCDIEASVLDPPPRHYELNAEPDEYVLTGHPAALLVGPAAVVGYAVSQVVAYPPTPEPAYHLHGDARMTGFEVVVAWALVTAWLLRQRDLRS